MACHAAAHDDLAQNQGWYQTMPLNPLNWTAKPFLTLYVAVAMAAVLLVLVLRRSVTTGPDPMGPTISDPVLLAWLTGGPRRAADTVLVAFLECGVADQVGRRGRLSIDVTRGIDLTRGPLPDRFRRFTGLTNGAGSVTAFRRAIRPALEEVRNSLIQQGLAPAREVTAQLGRHTWMIFAIPLILGSAKCVVGLERGRPVGILFFLLLCTLAIALYLSANPPFRTQAGRTVAADALRLRSRAARAPQDSEVTLAFALSGAAVLAGRPYARLLVQGGGSGCGGGTGCGGGGDGGGGGGCGGCSSG
jgi:uncharacterized protein (TIGR04222 family)